MAASRPPKIDVLTDVGADASILVALRAIVVDNSATTRQPDVEETNERPWTRVCCAAR